jgi:hypothetical protein
MTPGLAEGRRKLMSADFAGLLSRCFDFPPVYFPLTDSLSAVFSLVTPPPPLFSIYTTSLDFLFNSNTTNVKIPYDAGRAVVFFNGNSFNRKQGRKGSPESKPTTFGISPALFFYRTRAENTRVQKYPGFKPVTRQSVERCSILV